MVELVRSYSKRSDLAFGLVKTVKLLAQAREQAGERLSVESTGRVGRVHAVSERLGAETVQKIVDQYRSGVIARELAEDYGISLSSVRRLLRKAGARVKDVMP